jgi:hypothetical protein
MKKIKLNFEFATECKINENNKTKQNKTFFFFIFTFYIQHNLLHDFILYCRMHDTGFTTNKLYKFPS